MRTSLSMLVVAALLAAPRPSQAASHPDKRFAAPEKMGARIAETVGAVVAATHALEKSKYDPPHANTFFALQQRDTWYVFFGWLEPNGSKFTPALVVAGPRKDLSKMEKIPVEKAPRDVTRYARVVSNARFAASKLSGSPNVNPVLAPNGKELDVYVLQGPGRNAILLGGDFLDRYDAAGKRLISRTQFHKSIIPVALKDPKHPDRQQAGSFHTHVIDEEPTATDVAEVLIHPELAPMFVQGRSGKAYRVDEDGKIHEESKLAANSSTPVAMQPGMPDVPPAPGADGGMPAMDGGALK